MFDRLVITVLGNVVTEPALRVVPGTNDELVSFRMAVDNGYWDREQKQEVKTGTTFLSVTCKGKLGENVLASNYSTGTRLIVHGELTTKEYKRKDESTGLDVKLKALDVGPSNMWTEVRVPPKESRGGGGQPAAQGQGGDGWQPQYRPQRQTQPQGGGDPWDTRQPPQGDPYGDPWA